MGTYLLCLSVEPVSNIGASSKDDRVTLGLRMVIMDQLGQVENLIEERDPAIIVQIVFTDLFGCVEIAQLVWSWIALGIGSGQGMAFLSSRRWNSRSHLLAFKLN